MLMSQCFYLAVDAVYGGVDEMILLCYLMLIFCVIYCFWHTYCFAHLGVLAESLYHWANVSCFISQTEFELMFFAFNSLKVYGGRCQLLYVTQACHSYSSVLHLKSSVLLYGYILVCGCKYLEKCL